MTDALPQPVTAPFSAAQRASLFNLIRRAARAEIMPRFRRLDAGMVGEKSGPLDLITEADTAAEAMIARGLARAFPHAVIIGEEASGGESDYRTRLTEAELGFVIDPVDGTWNFAHGLPLFGTMVAATRFGRPVFGVIYDPVGRDLIWADLETPATWVTRAGIDRPLATKRPARVSEMTGYADLSHLPEAHWEAAMRASLDLAHVSTLRCSAHQYRLLAEGAVDFCFALRLNPWDHAAGSLICRQAGGHSAMLDGGEYDTSKDRGYLLSAGSEQTWHALAEQFSALKDTA
jgi:fructose-1,6-bisphosphatase/inositol monophosphatase family enzyme